MPKMAASWRVPPASLMALDVFMLAVYSKKKAWQVGLVIIQSTHQHTDHIIMTCIITGCLAFNGLEYAVGDLHRLGDCYVFNAVFHTFGVERGETDWGSDMYGYTKVVDFSKAADVWERRATIVAPVSQVTFNADAQDYLDDSLNYPGAAR